MSNIFPAQIIAEPSFMMPELVIKQNQASGAFECLAGGDVMTRLSEGDLYVYLKMIDIRTKVTAAQAAANQLPSVTIQAQMASTPTYLLRVRAEYDHHDTAAAARWGFGLPEGQRLGMRQGIFQQMRNALLYGYNAANGEGLVNGQGVTATTLPPDSNDNDTVLTYDNGEMAFYLASLVQALKTRTYNMGQGVRIVILGPQRSLGILEYNVVQLTQFQRDGAGVASTKGTFQHILQMNEDVLEWVYDDTLIGQGQGGTDLIIITMPEIKKPATSAKGPNTNEFANVSPSLESTNVMLVDMAAPREIPTPLPGGAIDVVSELRSTTGWTIRPEATTLLSAQYS